MKRPNITPSLSEAEFLRWYWLKSELAASCRKLGLATTGRKQEIAQRIAAHLAGRPAPASSAKIGRRAAMPSVFSPDSVIGRGWRCTQQLREFFVSRFGKSFRFNAPLRQFIASGSGQTLSAALAVYENSLREERPLIAAQFEYNRHMRDFKAMHPECTHKQAVAAWWQKRAQPRPFAARPSRRENASRPGGPL